MQVFRRTAGLFLIIFLGVLVVATFIAYRRHSGNTGIDVGKMHLLMQKKTELP